MNELEEEEAQPGRQHESLANFKCAGLAQLVETSIGIIELAASCLDAQGFLE
ncbi:hypothetical protein QWV57_02650 [Geobacillus zalihae]|uniref:hypothetical protein n=1 Tax=Geobacillus zalihae TaxID=213419 RepID=UPI002614C27D|nr:hypothetical protein [Geobacillus zalihae]WKA47900.1 hypothetical protein QWV57_02650 [Geobacillus zalihae]